MACECVGERDARVHREFKPTLKEEPREEGHPGRHASASCSGYPPALLGGGGGSIEEPG